MKKILIIGLLFLLAGCKTIQSTPTIDFSKYKNVTYCQHHYDKSRNFYYHGQIISNQKTLFGQKVFIFTYTKLDGKKINLTGDQVSNYTCLPVTSNK